MYAVGVAAGGPISLGSYLIGQAMVTAAQVTAHYVNEYADFDADRLVENRTFFSGGSGVLVAGHLGRGVALAAALTSTASALLLAVVVAFSSPLASSLGVVALAVSWAYSLPPIRLLGTGLGEIATSVVVVGVVPLVGLSVSGGQPFTALWWLVAALFAAHMAMMLAFELPDLESDRSAGKKVLAVRVGANFTLAFMTGLIGASALVIGLGIRLGVLPTFLWWAVASVAAGGAVVIVTARTRKYQVSTIAAVANLSTLGLFGLVAMVQV
jgi:1,4-dihydroxy-2-naphthoate octaprenyltransferase